MIKIEFFFYYRVSSIIFFKNFPQFPRVFSCAFVGFSLHSFVYYFSINLLYLPFYFAILFNHFLYVCDCVCNISISHFIVSTLLFPCDCVMSLIFSTSFSIFSFWIGYTVSNFLVFIKVYILMFNFIRNVWFMCLTFYHNFSLICSFICHFLLHFLPLFFWQYYLSLTGSSSFRWPTSYLWNKMARCWENELGYVECQFRYLAPIFLVSKSVMKVYFTSTLVLLVTPFHLIRKTSVMTHK